MPAAPTRNGAAEFSFVVGIVAVAFSFLPIVGEFVAAPASVLAVVLGFVGISRAERGLATESSRALIGIGLGVAAGSITLLVFVATSDFAS